MITTLAAGFLLAKYLGKPVPIVLLLKGDDAVYQVHCHVTASNP